MSNVENGPERFDINRTYLYPPCLHSLKAFSTHVSPVLVVVSDSYDIAACTTNSCCIFLLQYLSQSEDVAKVRQ
jgi:hypothetical protein